MSPAPDVSLAQSERQTSKMQWAASALGTLLLMALCTWGQLCLRILTGGQRPYTILYLIPVAIGAALLGARGGLIAALLAVVLARIYLFNDAKHGTQLLFSFPSMAEAIEFCALLAGTVTVATVTGRLRTVLGDLRVSCAQISAANLKLAETNHRLENANTRLVESEEQRRLFNRDVLMAVTGGKLRLVEPEEMPPEDIVSGAPLLMLPLKETADASRVRRTLQKLGEDSQMTAERIFDLCTGATEAATNAIKHGAGGDVKIWADADSITVQISDRGTGIAPAHLARAMLEQGYSSRVSLGMGFHLMLNTSDILALSTTPDGTSLLLRVQNGPRPSDEDALLARYVGL
jgi:anti-sigma regulatory factor (Ser/Thr protein kinase)